MRKWIISSVVAATVTTTYLTLIPNYSTDSRESNHKTKSHEQLASNGSIKDTTEYEVLNAPDIIDNNKIAESPVIEYPQKSAENKDVVLDTEHDYEWKTSSEFITFQSIQAIIDEKEIYWDDYVCNSTECIASLSTTSIVKNKHTGLAEVMRELNTNQNLKNFQVVIKSIKKNESGVYEYQIQLSRM